VTFDGASSLTKAGAQVEKVPSKASAIGQAAQDKAARHLAGQQKWKEQHPHGLPHQNGKRGKGKGKSGMKGKATKGKGKGLTKSWKKSGKGTGKGKKSRHKGKGKGKQKTQPSQPSYLPR